MGAADAPPYPSNWYRVWHRGCAMYDLGSDRYRNCTAIKNVVWGVNSRVGFDGTELNNVCLGSMHSNGTNAAMGDASVRLPTNATPPAILCRLASQAGRKTGDEPPVGNLP